MNDYLFVDIETTGLDENNSQILEIYACLVDDNFSPVNEFHRIFYHTDKIVDKIVDKMHTDNGLLAECSLSHIDNITIGGDFKIFIDTFFTSRKIILAGCSVHFDLRFLIANYPWLEEYLHHRVLDIRSILFVDPNHGKQIILPYRTDEHRAKVDCLNAVYTAKYYQNKLGAVGAT